MRDALRGAIAGAAATWAMDQVTTVMLALQAPDVTAREEAARLRGKSPVTNLVDKVEAGTGLTVPPARRPMVEMAVHYALGIIPGAIYGVARRWIPFARLGNGLAFGLAIFAVNDELLNTKLGLASEPAAYPFETHVRGFAGHAILGVTTESAIQVLGG